MGVGQLSYENEMPLSLTQIWMNTADASKRPAVDAWLHRPRYRTVLMEASHHRIGLGVWCTRSTLTYRIIGSYVGNGETGAKTDLHVEVAS